MMIRDATFNIVYSKISDLRRRFNEFEDSLGKYFNAPFELVPIPDSAPEEIPRIIANSIHGHTQLNIALTNSQFSTQFDDKYTENLNQCMSYLEERINYIYEVFSSFTDNRILFAGLTMRVLFDDISGDPIDLICDKFIKLKSSMRPFDISNRYTYILEEKYYLNIDISNVRIYEGDVHKGEKSLCRLKEKNHHVGLILDINDRFAFNFTEGYFTNYDNIKYILSLTEKMISDKSYKMIKEGVLKL